MEEIARRAGVSKQTVYNHYGSKTELVRAIIGRRVAEITAPLLIAGAEDRPEETLAAFGRAMLSAVQNPRGLLILKMVIMGSGEMPDMTEAFYASGPATSRRRLADFLRRETEAGRLAAEDPALAADFFVSMVIGGRQVAGLLGHSHPLSAAEVDRIAAEASRRFIRAYAPA
jgi:AcrR family transcriptional regulator